MKTAIKTLIKKQNLIIAGPCSVENNEQLLRTAFELKETKKVDILRAGIWKPRTNPGHFEGVGKKGLSWLMDVKKQTNLPTAVEVASAKHVEDALAFETDVLWIGARTCVNPFSVQEIAEALKGTDQTVLIKNPVNPDLKLWTGAVERIQKAGIESLGLIHRGFTTYGETEYRNAPIWQIPIEMKRLFPDLPMICDPSHISGKRDNLLKIAQKSIDLAYSGLMIESHYNPLIALTDKEQQVNAIDLIKLLESIQWKNISSEKNDYLTELEQLRTQIDSIDQEVLQLLANRMHIAQNIGSIKKTNDVTILQSNRWNELLKNTISRANKLNLNDEFVKNYMEAIHIESIRIQNLID
ncbi:MAG: bifunctional 3-deoxy-7-phosphoheptulonate synthase/chorismate mutase type II [Flavobacteriia bacterium]|nr:bifunctional 3-deoxy-7-phosphoheptulonate synthase/chorismate mutase type II [Flavobacteriia bacterium]